MKRIVFFTNYFPKLPVLNSFGTWAFDQAKAISKDNKVLVVTFTPFLPSFLKILSKKFVKWTSVFKEHRENENLEIVYIRINPFYYKNFKKFKKNPFFWADYFYRKTIGKIKKFAPDLIIANHVLIEGAVVNKLAGKLKVPYCCFEHSPDDFFPINEKHSDAYKKVINESKKFINVSEYSFTQIKNVYNFSEDKNFTLYNYSQDAQSLKDEKKLSDLKFYDRSKKYIVEVANFETRKNHLLVLKLFNELKNDFTEWNLVFVGSHRETLENIYDYVNENKLGDRVNIFCDMKHTDVLNLLNFMDIFILPSNIEMFSVSALEALSAALPLIITKYNGLTDKIFENYPIFNVDPKDEADIKEKLIKLMSDNDFRLRVSIENRKLYEAFFTPGKYRSNINDLINKLI